MRIAVLLAVALAIALALVWWLASPPAAVPPVPPAVVAASAPKVEELSTKTSAPPQAHDVPAYLRHVDPAMEICRQPRLAEQALEMFLVPGSRIQTYLETQTEDLRQYVIDTLGASAGDRPRLAAALLRGDVAAGAEIARRTEDGQAYGIAWRACQSRGAAVVFRNAASAGNAEEMMAAVERELATASPSCDALTLERWQQLQPENAAPWLASLNKAQAAGDQAGVVDALHHAGQAQVHDSNWAWLAGQVAAVLPADTPEGGRMLLLMDVIGREAALLGVTAMAPSTKACSAQELQNANRRQQCEQLADLLTQRSNTVLDLTIGAGLAERMGLPAARIPVTRQAIREAQLKDADDYTVSMERPGACAALRTIGDRLTETAQVGEWPALQRRHRLRIGKGKS
ncbi:hypothetical protein SNE35_21935 [Paucibacter sp. R3-3]|uniref:DUF2336 domain-containing protein n=1 Tax=Roseateles agri TaxID=3098619 RepID=A0ABU5DN81_9BURK|nr:hypothetical protein [Paucibacter sp. R3-3]MDY0747183.1 hypothetical protein [Paucibacter sp. R3-3]